MSSKRNQGRTSPFDNEPKRSNNLIEDDERILGAINAADRSLHTALPTSIYDIEPDPRQPRRAMPSAVRQLMASQKNLYQPVRFLLVNWAWLAYAEATGEQTTKAVLEKYRGCITGDMEIPQVSERDAPIQHSLYQVMGLAATIFQDGLINPITIAKHPDASSRYSHLIETGERRWLAHHLLVYFGHKDYDKIPAQIVEFNVWRQANENGRRDELNAIARARQFALLLMNLLEQDGATFAPMSSFLHEREYYAQVADAEQYRVPHGNLMKIAEAMGLKARQSINDYRRLLSLPDDVWVIGDDQSWSRDDLLLIVRDADNSDGDDREVDADPGQFEPVGEGEADLVIPNDDPPAPPIYSDEDQAILTLESHLVPQLGWVDAYKQLDKQLPDRVLFVEAHNGYIALREAAKLVADLIPSTVPGCHFANTEYGMAFFCPFAAIQHLIQNKDEYYEVAIMPLLVRFDDDVRAFWHTHMVKNRQSKPAATNPNPPVSPPVETKPDVKFIPKVGDQVVTRTGQIGKITYLVHTGLVRVKTRTGEAMHKTDTLRLATDAEIESQWPRPFALGERIRTQGPNEGVVTGYWQDQVLIRTDAGTDLQRPIKDAIRVEPEPPQGEPDTPRFTLPFSVSRDGIGTVVFDAKSRGVARWKPFSFGEQEAEQWLQGMVALTNGTMAHPQAQALFRVIEYLGGLAGPDYFPAQAMADLEMLRGFVDHAAGQMQKGGG